MSGTVFASDLGNTVKETLEGIVDDDNDGVKGSLIMPKWCSEESMDDQYYDWLEMGGVGLASDTDEGTEVRSVNINEGTLTRVMSRKFAMKMGVTEEAIEDNKYTQVVNAGARMKRGLYKTVDYDAANMLNRAVNASYTGADGVAFGSASHTLPGGGTFSNLGSAVAPSEAGYILHRAQVQQMPGHDGLIEGYELEKVVFPVAQLGLWEVLSMSKTSPVVNQFGSINVVEKAKLELIPLKYWTASTTNYCYLTDVDDGFKFLWRRKPKNRTWVENSQEVMMYSISARWARCWVDARCGLFVNA